MSLQLILVQSPLKPRSASLASSETRLTRSFTPPSRAAQYFGCDVLRPADFHSPSTLPPMECEMPTPSLSTCILRISNRKTLP